MAARDEIQVPRPVATTDLAYLAGIIDGEGHVMLNARHGKGIVLCMADIPILEWCSEKFGGSLSGRWINERGNARPRRIWTLSRSADLAFLIPKLLPLLVLKGAEAEIVLEAARMTLEPGSSNARSEEWHARRAALPARLAAAVAARK